MGPPPVQRQNKVEFFFLLSSFSSSRVCLLSHSIAFRIYSQNGFFKNCRLKTLRSPLQIKPFNSPPSFSFFLQVLSPKVFLLFFVLFYFQLQFIYLFTCFKSFSLGAQLPPTTESVSFLNLFSRVSAAKIGFISCGVI